MSDRRQESYAIRLEAAELARSRNHPDHKANSDEQKYAGDKYFMSFTKGLPHEAKTGLLHNSADFVEFRRAIDEGFIDPFSERVRHGSEIAVDNGEECIETQPNNFRQWEAPTAGVVYELEGPDPQAVTMPPAPPLIGTDGEANPELALEMAEVYELAILRDKPFNALEMGSEDNEINSSLQRLNNYEYLKQQTGRPRKVNSAGKLDLQTVFRGSSPGVEVGPYLSQFMSIGTVDRNGAGSVADGKIGYGVLQIDQRVPIAQPQKDFMLDLPRYVEVQRGLRPEQEKYLKADGSVASDRELPARRFISTPRDLATYVHYDELYEAYLNACLILLRMGTPFDPAFDHLSGGGTGGMGINGRRNTSGFALFGGPHILTLVTEVATRALKAVRFQKFNSHIRLRPEALAARIELLRDPSAEAAALTPPLLAHDISQLQDCLDDTLKEIASGVGCGTYFLPMAFPEGSPMHPSYGAGHATVAGACVTMLKAFFDTSAVLAKRDDQVAFKRFETCDEAVAFRAPAIPSDRLDEGKPVPHEPKQFLTLEGELNKLAANISIGRNMAGVHYFSDYYDSLRMGEEIALGILEEQALTYLTDPFVLSVPTFDGDVVRIGRR